MDFYTASSLGYFGKPLLHDALGVLRLWLTISTATTCAVLLFGFFSRILNRIKLALFEEDQRLPLPLFNRRRGNRRRFRLRVTRRNLTLEEGAILDTLSHAIDYLIDTHLETRNSASDIAAVELLLQGRAHLLASRPPLPSLRFLLRRRLAYVMSRLTANTKS